MIVLDTNVISALMNARRNPAIPLWLDKYRPAEVFTTTISMYEIQAGIEFLPYDSRRERLAEEWTWLLAEGLRSRILTFDANAARVAATMGAHLRSIGRQIPTADLFVAAIASSASATLVTRNVRHFENLGLQVLNPWDAP